MPDWCELRSVVASLKKTPIVVQFGSHSCVLCPAASQRINKLVGTHIFEWHYMDATISELAGELEVTKLPAIAVIHAADRYTLYQQLRDDDVNRVINNECEKRLVLDATF